MNEPGDFVLPFPSDLADKLPDMWRTRTALDEQMAAVIEWSAENVRLGGGPFAAAVYAMETGELVAPGVNRVVETNCSVAHAEIVALLFAQQRLGVHSLREADGAFRLVSSSEPCCQCFGAMTWAGIDELVYGATKHDVESIGFDEGPKPANWAEKLEAREVRVIGGVQREQAVQVLQAYAASGGKLYNA